VQLLGDAPAFSATDLNNYLACAHLTTLDLAALRGGTPRPTLKPPQAELLARLGQQHEERYLAYLRGELGLQVETIDGSLGYLAAAAATEDAMRRGVPVIYQGTFFDGTWLGHADFLRKKNHAPGTGGRWDWHYEVEDTKLARHTEPYFLLQLCYYSEHVARIQGIDPTWMRVVLGDGSTHEFRVEEFSAYFRSVKAHFLRALGGAIATYPEPNAHCVFCVWNPICAGRRAADDHLSGVANISRLQIARLTASGITTLRQLALAPAERVPEEMESRTFATLARQARLQHEQRLALARNEVDPYRYELLDESITGGRGLTLLPEPSPGDVFFDMEGDPYYAIGTGLEYLFGAVTADDGKFHAFWGCDQSDQPTDDRAAEKRAFEQFVDFIVERRRRYPSLHVYHYASYEKTALLKLALRHVTREREVDTLVREDVLVDLYRVVRQSVVVGQPSYSIKKIEDFYGKRGDASGVTGGGESILRFDEWLTTRSDRRLRDDAILADLEQYNAYDCYSTRDLRDWLLRLRDQAQSKWGAAIPWFAGRPPAADDLDPKPDRFDELRARLEARIPADFDAQTTSRPGDAGVLPFFLARHMLEYHAREDKPVWWQFHDRCETYRDDPRKLESDTETIIGLEPLGMPRPDKKSTVQDFSFPPQLHKLDAGDDCFDPATKEPSGEIVAIEDDEHGGVLSLRRGPTLVDVALPHAITVCSTARRRPVIDAIARFGEALLSGVSPFRYGAAFDVITAGAPRLRGRSVGAVLQPSATDEESIRAVVDALDDSYLFIQGPPGAGKTTLAAGLIAGLIDRGCRVGITANSHKSIHNLLEAIERTARERGIALTGIKKSTNGNAESVYESAAIRSTIGAVALDGIDIVAGTAWAFGPDTMDQQLDYLFIDEAGQMALPVALAAMTSARNAVLLGDPQQLAQVSHTSHPGDLGISVLDHLLGEERATIAPERGILLQDSYRMHPDVCRFISETMYESRLRSAPGRERQDVRSPGLSGTGLRLVAVAHDGNDQSSEQEAAAVADEIERLLAGTVTTPDGTVRALTDRDVIVVAPYNAHVRCIRRTLERRGGATARVQVGTVDKFQGREAYVVFFSTAASTAHDAPRGARFIFDRQRFNVAVSRARAMAVLVCSPDLLELGCSSIDDVRIANGVCRFVELAAR
jgi:uncharacterized protein